MKIGDEDVVRQVMDSLSYVKGYKERLLEFNKQFEPYKEVKVSYGAVGFLFPLEKAI